jgi:Ulp1 family protease
LLLSGGWLNSEVINTYMTLIEVKYCNLRPVVQY